MIYLTLLYLISPPLVNPQAEMDRELDRLLAVDPLDEHEVAIT